MMKSKVFVFDIDDTIITRPMGLNYLGLDKYLQCIPMLDNIKIVNDLYDSGHKIILYTARGMSVLNGDIEAVYDKLYNLTVQQLNQFNVKYHELFLGKLYYDYWVDDKAINVNDLKDFINDFKQ